MAQQNTTKNEDLARLVLEEVDEARETLELVTQILPAIPIKGMDEVVKATKGKITFRGSSFDVKMFVELVPEILFPIDDPEKLVRLAYQVVLAAPPTITYNLEDPINARREMQRAILRRLVSDGGIGPARPGRSAVFDSMVNRQTDVLAERDEG